MARIRPLDRARRPALPGAVGGAAIEPPITSVSGSTFFGAVGAYPVFRRLWLAAMAASVAQWMQQIAIGWLALDLTDSAAFVGTVTLAAGLPFLVIAPLGGALIDRFDRRRLLLAGQAAAAALAILVAADVIAGVVQPWHLPVIACLTGSLQALLNPTQQSLVPTLVDRAALTNAIGLMSAGQNLTRLAGPPAAGVVIAVYGTGQAFLLQAAALLVAFAFAAGLVMPARLTLATTPRGALDGIRLIARRPDLRGLFLLACIPTLFVFPYIFFLNVIARDILGIGSQGLGLLMAASGSGAVIGSLLVAARRQSEGVGRRLIAQMVLYGLIIVGVVWSRSVWLTAPLLVVAGSLGANFMSTNNAMMQHRVGDDIRGRVTGAYVLTWGLMPLGAWPIGQLAGQIGTPAAITIGALISSALVAWLGLTSRGLRDL